MRRQVEDLENVVPAVHPVVTAVLHHNIVTAKDVSIIEKVGRRAYQLHTKKVKILKNFGRKLDHFVIQIRDIRFKLI